MRTNPEFTDAAPPPKPGEVIEVDSSISGTSRCNVASSSFMKAAIVSYDVPSAAVALMRKLLRSSIGASSVGSEGGAQFSGAIGRELANAEFDIEFLDAELGRIGRSRFADHCLRVICSLQHAREQHPGKRNSLDALCERYAVSNAHRTLQADVFLAMTRGQDSLVIDVLDDDALTANFGPIDVSLLVAVAVPEEEVAAHEALLDLIAREARVTPVWRLTPAHA